MGLGHERRGEADAAGRTWLQTGLLLWRKRWDGKWTIVAPKSMSKDCSEMRLVMCRR